MTSTCVLVADATNLTHRAWHALGPDSAPADIARRVLDWSVQGSRSVSAAGLLLAFDGPAAGAHRYQMYPQYKSGRAEKDPRLSTVLRDAPAALRDIGASVFSAEGAEADDVLATYAASGEPVVLLTSDKDAIALLAYPRVRLIRPRNGTPASQWQAVDGAEMARETGVDPSRWPVYAACKGDPSDAIPGLPGIGAGFAQKLAERFATVTELEEDLRAGAPVTAVVVGNGRAARLAAAADDSIAALRLAAALTQPLPVPDIPSRESLAAASRTLRHGAVRMHVRSPNGEAITLF